MSKATVAELEVLFTANTAGVDKAETQVRATATKIEKSPIEAKVGADVSDALQGMDRVEQAGKKIVSEKTMATVDANIDRAEKNLSRTQERLDYLKSVETDLEVTADISRAEKQLARAQASLDGLTSAKAKMEVVADTSRAEGAVKELADTAVAAASEGGRRAGDGLVSGLDGATRGAGEMVGTVIGGDLGSSLESALAAIPVAGGVILAAGAIGKAIIGAIQDGMNIEVGVDRLEALTGITPAQAQRLAAAAAEAYTHTFGESVEANMDTAKLALQFDLIDADSSVQASQKVIAGLAGIADVLGEDVQPVATAVAMMLRTGLVSSAQEAFDVLAAGARNGLNITEDLLDSFTEYPTLFRALGLDAATAMGLMNQGLQAGARNSDLVADSLKEFQIRATDASDSSREAFQTLGMDADAMFTVFANGGPGAKDALGLVLDSLRGMTDPLEQNRVGVALFGTQWEDMAGSILELDVSTAVDSLDGVTGAAQRMFDTLSENDASKLEEAQRNIEVAMDGVKGALASAFSEPLGDLAEWVSANRGPLIEFFQDLVNGAIDFAIAMNEGLGSFVSGPLATAIEGLSGLINRLPGKQDTSDLDTLAESMRNFDETTGTATEKLEGMRDKFNVFADGQVALGYVHDAAQITAAALGEIGFNADGTAMSMSLLKTGFDMTTASGQQLDGQIRTAIDALEQEIATAGAAGASQGELTSRYMAATGALKEQLIAMGLTDAQAQALIDSYYGIPGKVTTNVTAPGATQARTHIDELRAMIALLPPEKQTEITAALDRGDVAAAEAALNYASRTRTAVIRTQLKSGTDLKTDKIYSARGNLLQFMASGGLSPMAPIAQMVPPNTWRVVGDRARDDEAYIPLDGSVRSWTILLEALRRMPGSAPMADGGVVGGTQTAASMSPGAGTLVVVDADGALIGRMRVAARQEISGLAAAVRRR